MSQEPADDWEARRRNVKLILICAVVIALLWPVWVYLLVTWHMGRQVRSGIAALQAAGQPVTMAEVAPKPAPPGQNAAEVYQKVFQVDFSRGGSGPPLLGFTDDERRFLFVDYLKPGAGGDAEAAALLGRPEAVAALGLLEEGSRRPECAFPVEWDPLVLALFPHMSKFRAACQLVTAQAKLDSRRGETDQAMHWLAVGVRMSRHAGSEPTLIPQLVRYAMVGILAKPAPEVLDRLTSPGPGTAELARALAEEDLEGDFTRAMAAERTGGLNTFELVAKSSAREASDLSGSYDPILGAEAWLAGLRYYDELVYLDLWDQLMPLAGRPYVEAARQAEQVGESHTDNPLARLTYVVTPMYTRSMSKRDQTLALIAVWRVALALKEYRAARGEYPESLEALQKTLGWRIPEDVFSGKLLVYRREGEGFLVYSVGPNQIDDLGVKIDYRSGGDEPTGDVGWKAER